MAFVYKLNGFTHIHVSLGKCPCRIYNQWYGYYDELGEEDKYDRFE